jgi:hypothetical protein
VRSPIYGVKVAFSDSGTGPPRADLLLSLLAQAVLLYSLGSAPRRPRSSQEETSRAREVQLETWCSQGMESGGPPGGGGGGRSVQEARGGGHGWSGAGGSRRRDPVAELVRWHVGDGETGRLPACARGEVEDEGARARGGRRRVLVAGAARWPNRDGEDNASVVARK